MPTRSALFTIKPFGCERSGLRSFDSHAIQPPFFAVQRRAAPERQDMAEQVFTDLRGKLFQFGGLDHWGQGGMGNFNAADLRFTGEFNLQIIFRRYIFSA